MINSMLKEGEKGMKVTIYTSGEFMGNIIKYEGKLDDYGTRDWAQYPEAPFVEFIPKGKRSGIRIVKGYSPYILILAGWDNPDPDDMYLPEEDRGNGVTSRMSRHSSFDRRWRTDFDEVIQEALNKDRIAIIANFRKKEVNV